MESVITSRVKRECQPLISSVFYTHLVNTKSSYLSLTKTICIFSLSEIYELKGALYPSFKSPSLIANKNNLKYIFFKNLKYLES